MNWTRGADHQVKAAMYEILVKIARYQMRHSMDENNVLAAFTGFAQGSELNNRPRDSRILFVHNDGKNHGQRSSDRHIS